MQARLPLSFLIASVGSHSLPGRTRGECPTTCIKGVYRSPTAVSRPILRSSLAPHISHWRKHRSVKVQGSERDLEYPVS